MSPRSPSPVAAVREPAAVLDDAPMSLRERKRAQTRERIVLAGVDLFTEKGYDETTVADIAAAADIGTRTFFGYFESKDALLFDDGSDRVALAVETIAAASPDEAPARVLLRALDVASSLSSDLVSPRALLRLRLADTVPAVRARAARAQQEGLAAIGNALLARFPALDPAAAAAMAGAFVGASASAIQSVLTTADADSSPARLAKRIRAAVAVALGIG